MLRLNKAAIHVMAQWTQCNFRKPLQKGNTMFVTEQRPIPNRVVFSALKLKTNAKTLQANNFLVARCKHNHIFRHLPISFSMIDFPSFLAW